VTQNILQNTDHSDLTKAINTGHMVQRTNKRHTEWPKQTPDRSVGKQTGRPRACLEHSTHKTRQFDNTSDTGPDRSVGSQPGRFGMCSQGTDQAKTSKWDNIS